MKKYLLLGISAFLLLPLFAQQTSVLTWQRMLETLNLSESLLYETCPNFPSLNEVYVSSEAFTQEVVKWESDFYKEIDAFWSLKEVKEGNPSAYYLGLQVRDLNEYQNSFMQWVEESKISRNRLLSIAPHFPIDASSEEIDRALTEWRILYGHEYEIIINDRQLTALNPYYTEYLDIVQIPKFISALISEERPVLIQTENAEADALRLKLQTQNWYFVFHPEEFEAQYGFYPEFPEWFDADDFRQKIKERIKANAEAEASGLNDPNEVK